VGLHGLRAEEQLCGDLRISLAVDDETRDLMLAFRQRLGADTGGFPARVRRWT
jgi:hypothetical protein